jgi:hypothetical protein
MWGQRNIEDLSWNMAAVQKQKILNINVCVCVCARVCSLTCPT